MEVIPMTDLKCLLESFRINFAQHEIITWTRHYEKIDNGFDKIYPAFVNYEIAGSFISEDNIKVIVYKNISLNEVQKFYPVIKDKKQDYRYVEYNQVLAYLDKKIKEIERFRREDSDQENKDLYDSLQNTLNNTKGEILERLR